MTTATAHSNIALVKYWGKRDTRLNLPATGSLSMTLGALTTTTTIVRGERDAVLLAGQPAPAKFAAKVLAHLDLLAREVGTSRPAMVVTTDNDFPTAAGLASSASGFAALSLAGVRALEASVSTTKLSEFARRGSGSAARSLHGGWVAMDRGERSDGADSVARQIATPDHWDLRCVVLATTTGAKSTGSTDGMDLTSATSPYYSAWVSGVSSDLVEAHQAVAERDFEKLTDVAERSCMRMHASAMGANPAVLYWNGGTVELIHRVRALRASGHAVFFTIDAGPHVKVFCPPDEVPHVLDAAASLVKQTIVSPPGGPAQLVERP